MATPRGLRYLEWTWDPEPSDNTYVVDYAYLLRTADGAVRVEHDRHIEGLFARADWLRLLSAAGFEARSVPFEHSELEPGTHEVFVAVRPDRCNDVSDPICRQLPVNGTFHFEPRFAGRFAHRACVPRAWLAGSGGVRALASGAPRLLGKGLV